jgi:hypothetical protein
VQCVGGRLRNLAPALASYDGATELERGLDILLTGLADSLTPARRRRRGSVNMRAGRRGGVGSGDDGHENLRRFLTARSGTSAGACLAS